MDDRQIGRERTFEDDEALCSTSQMRPDSVREEEMASGLLKKDTDSNLEKDIVAQGGQTQQEKVSQM